MDTLCVSTGVKRPRYWEENAEDNSQTPSNLLCKFPTSLALIKRIHSITPCFVLLQGLLNCAVLFSTPAHLTAIPHGSGNDSAADLQLCDPQTPQITFRNWFQVLPQQEIWMREVAIVSFFCNWYLILKAWAIKKSSSLGEGCYLNSIQFYYLIISTAWLLCCSAVYQVNCCELRFLV